MSILTDLIEIQNILKKFDHVNINEIREFHEIRVVLESKVYINKELFSNINGDDQLKIAKLVLKSTKEFHELMIKLDASIDADLKKLQIDDIYSFLFEKDFKDFLDLAEKGNK